MTDAGCKKRLWTLVIIFTKRCSKLARLKIKTANFGDFLL
jgi:hypothetical protein